MQKPFKLRHSSEIAGTFVLLALALFIAGVFIASENQGWFEEKFSLKTSFDKESGAFGLREGNDVIIMNTLAGRVDKITPTLDGKMEVSLIIKESFRQFVHEDSVAKVKKKFVAAGDSYLEIEPGKGYEIADGAYIEIIKDEEIMDTAQKVLADVQEVVLPMVEEVQEMLEHVNAILEAIEKGDGTAGTLVNDEELARDIKSVVRNSDLLLEETQRTFRETTRMVRAAQKTWLLRKHVDSDEKDITLLSPIYMDDETFSEYESSSEAMLDKARFENKSILVAHNAVDLGYLKLYSGESGAVAPLIAEAKSELTVEGKRLTRAHLLEAELLREQGKHQKALKVVLDARGQLNRSDRELNLQCLLLAADISCDLVRHDDASGYMKTSEYFEKKLGLPAVSAEAAEIRGRVNVLKGDFKAAAEEYDREASHRAAAAQYSAMARAFVSAGDAHGEAGASDKSADRYYRAGRSLLAAGDKVAAKTILSKARDMALKSKNDHIADHSKALLKE